MQNENILYTKGEPLKKRSFSLELTEDTITRFIQKVYEDGTTPAEVLEGFINDLVCGSHTRGSDERELAAQYYDRCGYGFLFQGEHKTFTQWLLCDFSMEEAAAALEDKRDYEEEVKYLKKHPEEAEEGELERLEGYIRNCTAKLEELHKDYARKTTKPETLEEGLKGVSDYMEVMNRAKEGGTI